MTKMRAVLDLGVVVVVVAVVALASRSQRQDPRTVHSPTGLTYSILRAGTGPEASKGRTVSVHYIGTLASGKKFDSSRDRNQPIAFVLGKGMVIPGWEEGIAGMKVGEERRLIIPPELGYGPQGCPPLIPPKATLYFDTELMDVR